MDYSDQPVAYVEVTAVDGQTVTYETPEAKEVLFTPDVLPVKLADDLDGDPTNHSLTIAVSDMTYTDAESADLGLGPDTVVEEGDFLALGTGSTEDERRGDVRQDHLGGRERRQLHHRVLGRHEG